MNAYSRTLQLPAGPAVTSPVRERGASALDDRSMWAPPDPDTMVLDPWGAPPARLVIRTVLAPWPAPDAASRRDMAPPTALQTGASTVVEPFHPIDMPDVLAARRVAGAPPPEPVWAPPTPADAAAAVLTAPPAPVQPAATDVDRSGVRRRLAIGLAAVAGTACAAVAAAVAFL